MFTKDPSGISKDLMKTYAYSSQMLWPSYSSTFLLQVKAEISQIYPGNQDFIPVWLADMYSPARPVWISKERKEKKKKKRGMQHPLSVAVKSSFRFFGFIISLGS